jgi:hypothetical protein
MTLTQAHRFSLLPSFFFGALSLFLCLVSSSLVLQANNQTPCTAPDHAWEVLIYIHGRQVGNTVNPEEQKKLGESLRQGIGGGSILRMDVENYTSFPIYEDKTSQKLIILVEWDEYADFKNRSLPLLYTWSRDIVDQILYLVPGTANLRFTIMGHSRGALLENVVIQTLQFDGFSVRYAFYADPHPINRLGLAEDIQSDMVRWEKNTEKAVYVPNGVPEAINLYQQNGLYELDGSPNGLPLIKAEDQSTKIQNIAINRQKLMAFAKEQGEENPFIAKASMHSLVKWYLILKILPEYY